MRTRLVVVLPLALALASCGGKKDPPAGDPPAPSAGTSPPAAAAPAAPAADPVACKVLTKDDAKLLAGLDLDDGQAGTDPGGNATCEYKHAKPYARVSILVYPKGQFAYDEDVKAELLGKPPVEIAGIGTKAVRNAESTAIGVLANGKFTYVLVARMAGTPTAEDAEKTARAIASRM